MKIITKGPRELDIEYLLIYYDFHFSLIRCIYIQF